MFKIKAKTASGFIKNNSASMSLGQAVIAADEFKSLAENKNSSALIELKSTLAAISPRTPFAIYKSLPHIPASSNLVFGIREVGALEDASKPKTDLEFESVEYPICSITAPMKIPRELLDNPLGIANHIDTKLHHQLINKIDWQLIYGNGGKSGKAELSGLMQPRNHSTYTAQPGDTLIDAINRAKWALWGQNGWPDKAFVNPEDWNAVEMAKGSDGCYLYGLPGTLIKTNFLGIEIIPNPWVPKGKFIVGNFNYATMVWDRENIMVAIEFDEQDRDRNIMNVRIEVQLALEISTPSAILVGEFTA